MVDCVPGKCGERGRGFDCLMGGWRFWFRKLPVDERINHKGLVKEETMLAEKENDVFSWKCGWRGARGNVARM